MGVLTKFLLNELLALWGIEIEWCFGGFEFSIEISLEVGIVAGMELEVEINIELRLQYKKFDEFV